MPPEKESLHPNTRRIVIDLGNVRPGWPQVTVAAGDFYDRCRPLVEETLHATEDLLAASGFTAGGPAQGEEQRLEALYMTGGGSELPLVGRMLRESFGRRVRRSAYTRAATAIGLAIQADATQGYVLRDRFTRHFGVWREAEGGRSIVSIRFSKAPAARPIGPAAAQLAALLSGPQHRPFPVSGMHALDRRRPSGGRHYHLGRHSLSF